jgi:hypothetical protein
MMSWFDEVVVVVSGGLGGKKKFVGWLADLKKEHRKGR